MASIAQLTSNFSIGGSFIWKKGGDLVGRIRPNATKYTPVNWLMYTDRNGQARTVTLQSAEQHRCEGQHGPRHQPAAVYHQAYKGFVVRANKRMSREVDDARLPHRVEVDRSERGQRFAGIPSSQQNSNVGNFGRDPNDFINSDGVLTGDRPYYCSRCRAPTSCPS